MLLRDYTWKNLSIGVSMNGEHNCLIVSMKRYITSVRCGSFLCEISQLDGLFLKCDYGIASIRFDS